MSLPESKYLYAALIAVSAAYPLAQSFERRLRYYKSWPGLLRGIGLMALLFIPWDIYFTEKGVWWFNDRYISGVKIAGLPVEEWSFFLIVPFACVFIHEVQKFFFRWELSASVARVITLYLFGFLLVLAMIYRDRLYPVTTFSLSALALGLLAVRMPHWTGRFYMTWAICWLPFLLINGALTGNFTEEATVNYNREEMIGFRITTIPMEDSVYNLLMMLIVIAVYEGWKGKRTTPLKVQ